MYQRNVGPCQQYSRRRRYSSRLDCVWDEAEGAERLHICMLLYGALADAYRLSIGDARYFKRSDLERHLDKGYKLARLEREYKRLLWWLHSNQFRFYMKAIGFDEVRVRDYIVETAQGAHADRIGKFINIMARIRQKNATTT